MLSPHPCLSQMKRVDCCTRGQSPVYSSTVAKSSIIIRKFLQHSGWPGLFCGARRRVEIDTDVEFKGYHPTWTWPSSSSSYALAFAYASSSTQLSFQSFICKVKVQIILQDHKKPGEIKEDGPLLNCIENDAWGLWEEFVLI